MMPGWNVLELWRDGVLIYVADPRGALTWGQQRPQWELLINPLALCEMIYVFVELTRILNAIPKPNPLGVLYTLGLRHLNPGRRPAGLRQHLYGFADIHTAPADEFTGGIDWLKNTVGPPTIAFRLVAEVFQWFTFDDSEIPYAREKDDGEMIIDPNSSRPQRESTKVRP
jgi:hypothetical protein